ncbi:uncharacterized protein LOC120295866 [Eucalyptus grandis]|uniref:uncharacterized protein LOC120295866 n=1 Tax=Eucalyptus grandis TaxID=71139 RepID=UPI00192EE611|nr:uncharacterized protein LOC120295866 [Eucalyptus grandis]
MSIEWGLPTVCDILKGAVILIKRPVKYAMSSKSFADDLREEVRKLENEARRVHDLAQVARNNSKCQQGLEEARKLLDDFDKASKTCCYGTLPDPYCRYRFSTKAEAEIQVIRGLAQDCIRFKALDDICFINTASGNVTAPTPARRDGKDAVQSTTATASVCSASTSIKLRNDDVFESRALMIRKIMDALANNSNSVVGVYGMGGIGKSTLLVDVERKIREEKSFDWVAKADVSENPDIKTIQGEIADALGLTEIKEKETISGRARLLHDRLKDEEREKKKVLIILDNLWEGLDLNKVGIPRGPHNNVMGCKLLLTSRDRDVLRREMGCDKAFHLSGLKEEEAKRLFERMVGDKVHDDKFKPWVKVALDKCAGLELFRDVNNMEEARNRLKSGICSLQASSLLLDNGGADDFKIHDLVRDFVALFVFRDHPLLVLKDEDKSITGLLKDKLKSCRAVCFPYVDMKELPQELDCPELQIFLLFTNNESLEVPYSLFRSMRKLMVLNLTGLRLTCTPLSPFQFLENLHTLCLDRCSLDNVAILGELKGLQILSFMNSDIYQLPREIGQLVELRLLDLNHCSQLEIIEPGVLQSLINLEELYMLNSFAQWNAMDQTPPTNASLIELNHMKNLCTLHVSIPNPSVLPEDLNVEKLTKYKIQIGNVLHSVE